MARRDAFCYQNFWYSLSFVAKKSTFGQGFLRKASYSVRERESIYKVNEIESKRYRK